MPQAQACIWIVSEAGEESEEPIGSEGEASGWMESIMEESAGLAFDNPCSGSDTTVTRVDSPSVPPFAPRDESGDCPPTRSKGSAPHSLGSPMEAGGMPPLVPAVTMPASGVDTVEAHVPQSNLDNL